MLGSGPTFYGLETLPGQCHSDDDLRWCVRYESDVTSLRKTQTNKKRRHTEILTIQKYKLETNTCKKLPLKMHPTFQLVVN